MELKTRPTKTSVAEFLNAIEDPQRRADCKAVAKLMRDVTGKAPTLWGTSIVGFGRYKYTNTIGSAEWPVVAFSPRKQNLTLYVMPGFDGYAELLAALGPHKTGKSCLYLKRLSDIDLGALKKLVSASVKHMRSRYETDLGARAKKTQK